MRFFNKKNDKTAPKKDRQTFEIEFEILTIVLEYGMDGISFNELRETLGTSPKMLRRYLSNLSFALDVRRGNFPSWKGPHSKVKIFPMPGKTEKVCASYKAFFDERGKMFDAKPSA